MATDFTRLTGGRRGKVDKVLAVDEALKKLPRANADVQDW